MDPQNEILFVLAKVDERTSTWDGETFRTGGVGLSGTEQSAILVAEALAHNNGWKPTIYSRLCNHGVRAKGVTYVNRLDPAMIKRARAVSVMCWDFNVLEYCANMAPGSKLIIWCACVDMLPVDILERIKRQGLIINVIHISEWSRDALRRLQHGYSNIVDEEWVIPNPIMTDMVHTTSQGQLQDAPVFTFHATFERGGHIATRVFERLPYDNKQFHIFDYYSLSNSKGYDGQSGIVNHASSDKATLFAHLAQAKYFVYPLVLPNGIIHKDTFACCVAEALAHGMIVLTYPVAALKEYYEGRVVWLPFPEGVSTDAVQSPQPFDQDMSFYSEDALNKITRMIEDIETQPERYNALRRTNMEWASSEFSPERIGKQWHTILGGIVLK